MSAPGSINREAPARPIRSAAQKLARATLLAAALCGLTACQSLTPSTPVAGAQFAGRLGVKVDGDEQRSFSASFELRGDAHHGWMALSNPLGTQIGRAEWAPRQSVRLLGSDGLRQYDSLDAMAEDLMGQALPIAALFDWLDGRPWSAAAHSPLADAGRVGFRQLGWDVQLERQQDGLIVAVREQPSPRVTVRAKLDTP
ncbi:conserved hypothetical protein [Leptothrix cholodnii SP-6]|uniref:Outer-membrane lipoprotein LolB n=1 Tax=Leptothrix cholodnii (strain ATCC 51168 / LMG 8142 / SP-6) TaxID=395495 RepID=B1Y3P7_LEPCP|nr:lipoprotein insertase outer membrane protein LolB [Leptothrix cholodnii]ACB35750.1 conserved hypothetical protein [Leptothrix cholodnii SP-6]